MATVPTERPELPPRLEAIANSTLRKLTSDREMTSDKNIFLQKMKELTEEIMNGRPQTSKPKEAQRSKFEQEAAKNIPSDRLGRLSAMKALRQSHLDALTGDITPAESEAKEPERNLRFADEANAESGSSTAQMTEQMTVLRFADYLKDEIIEEKVVSESPMPTRERPTPTTQALSADIQQSHDFSGGVLW
eukprot:CAMPEP_0172595896 /NCGR_PEP_ID=MMETSP1068-20121228/15568_1 /TAXON_ID=35684 /ORGANISM="Pseudopedinella elastica, Strain CCMP716" /LENGTH=190 /DNA_ID=CAMNT_0013394655 /DNA_START=216 /DNA_END=785 /DNA_ORIENTATION=+